MDYFVLDLETANPDYASICQIGVVEVRAGAVVDQAAILVDPDDFFDPMNIAIHGIGPAHVEGAPRFDHAYASLGARLANAVVVHHGPFDRIAIQRACQRYGLPAIDARWLDNQRVVRRTWVEFAKGGYALKKLAQHFDLEFQHHDALEDARVTEIIFRHALAETGLSPFDWLARVEQPIARSRSTVLTKRGVCYGGRGVDHGSRSG